LEPPGPAQQALTAGKLILTLDPDDGLWALRWTERSTAPRAALTPDQTGPLDEAYRHAQYLRDESAASHVSVTLNDQPEPALVSAVTQSSDTPASVTEIALRCPNPDVLTTWAVERFGVTTWNTLDAATRVEQ